MKKLYFLFLLLASTTALLAQPCFPQGWGPTSQEEIDNFATLYPNCTELAEGLYLNDIFSPQIKNLDGLAPITRIHGQLHIEGMDSLKNLNGLQNVTHIGSDFSIYLNNGLTNLSGLDGLDSIGGSILINFSTIEDISDLNNLSYVGGDIRIDDSNIDQISGLNNLTTIGGNLEITYNNLNHISGFQNLTTLNGALILNFSTGSISTTSISGLNSLEYIGGGINLIDITAFNDLSHFANLTTLGGLLTFDNCYNLKSFSGLDNLTSINGPMYIYNCTDLKSFSGLEGITSINGKLQIENCMALESLMGLQNLTTLGDGLAIYNSNLTSFAGLENLESINGIVNISSNESLVSVAALSNVNPTTISDLKINWNNLLSVCESNSICNYLGNGNDASISNNAPNCDGETEILAACSGLLSKVRYYPFYDLNQNQLFDTNEPIYKDANLAIDPLVLSAFPVSENGGTLFLEPGDYTLSIQTNPFWAITTGSSAVPINLSAPNSCDTVFFGLYPNTFESSYLTSINAAPARCDWFVQFNLNGKNLGTTTANGILWFEIDENIDTIQFVNLPDTIVDPGKYGWFFSDLYPSQSIAKSIKLKIPGPLDFPIGEELHFKSYLEYEDMNGAQITSEFLYDAPVFCAYDPNDKLVNPSREGNYILFEEQITYTVRFQNTGNDFAYDVVIRDTLDANLDASTFRLLGSSHNNQLTTTLKEGQFLTFAFNNIFLPDSTSDFDGSQGYVSYLIEENENLPEETKISNTASIYFDTNPPVVTNTTENLMVSELPTIAIDPEVEQLQFTIFPNPTKDKILVVNEQVSNAMIELRDYTGRLLTTLPFDLQQNINLTDYPSGVYWIQVKTEKTTFSQKVIKF